MTKYRLAPSHQIGTWCLYEWVEWKTIFGRTRGYWTYVRAVPEDGIPELKRWLSQREEHFTV